MQKTVIIFHGFPGRLLKNKSPLLDYFLSRRYKVIMPNLLAEKLIFDINKADVFKKSGLNFLKADVIVGISMGGLLAPQLAKYYPRSKLVLIATGPYIKTRLQLYNFFVRLLKYDKSLMLIKIAQKTPLWLYRFLYKFSNHQSNGLTNSEYVKRADENWGDVSKIPLATIRKVINFVNYTNNTNLLSHLKNKTIIFSGKYDSMMPLELSEMMSKLIKSSKLIVSNKLHYDVFTRENYADLDKFLKDK